jgi:hypothetical protein
MQGKKKSKGSTTAGPSSQGPRKGVGIGPRRGVRRRA